MKKFLSFMMALSLVLAIAACNTMPEETTTSDIGCPTSNPIEKETTYDPNHVCTTTAPPQEFTSSRDDIEPLYPSVKMYDANGNEILPYSEMIYFTDGTVVGDGALIFMSVSSRLPAIADKIPLVNLGGTPKIEATARDGVSIRGGETVNVYDEDFSVLAERLPLSELWEKGNARWQGKTVYIYFTVSFSDDTSDYVKETENGYFVKTTFISHSSVKLIGAGDEVFDVYAEMIADGPADYVLGFTAVEEYLPKIAEKIPLVTLDETSAISIRTEEGIAPVWSDTVSVYGEDFTLLAENIALGAVVERTSEWDGDVLYLYFFVRFEETDDAGALVNVVEKGYFALVALDRGELPSLLDAELILANGERVFFYREAVSYTNGFVTGDGPLVFSSMEMHLRKVGNEIPTFSADKDMSLYIPSRDGVMVSGGETFEVYSEDFERLGVYTLSEIINNKEDRWNDMSVYLVLWLTITEDSVPICHTTNVYYVKIN